MRSSEAFFARHPVFTHEEYAASRSESKSRRTVDSLLRKHEGSGRIVRVRRGLYATVPRGVSAEAFEVDPYLIATKATADAIISHHAALQFHGCAYSIWDQVTFTTQHSARPFRFQATAFVPVHVPKSLLETGMTSMGVVHVKSDHSAIRVTTCERTLVDVLCSPALGGGWEEIWRSLEMVEFFDLDAVITYALASGSAVVAARVGLFLEQHQEALFVEDKHLAQLAAYTPKQVRYFDTARAQGHLVKPWNLIVPERLLNKAWEEVA